MMIIGCDFHPRFQQIAFVDQESGEYGERRLDHPEEAVQFYRGLSGKPVRIGLEATGSYRWFRRLVLGLGHELLVGDPSAIHATIPRRQQTDKRDARHILKLLVEDRFPAIWLPSEENEQVRQLLVHRCRMVQLRTRVKNQLDGGWRTLSFYHLDRRPILGAPSFERILLEGWDSVDLNDEIG